MTCWRFGAPYGPMMPKGFSSPKISWKECENFTGGLQFKARHICTEGLANKFQESCSEISPHPTTGADADGNIHTGTHCRRRDASSLCLSGSNAVFFHKPHPDVCFFDVPSKVSHIITHVLPTLTLSCLRWLHQIVHLVFSWRSFCLLSLLYSSIFFHGLIPTSSGNESSAHFRRERPSGLALTLISARCSMSKRMFLGLGWLGAFRTVVFSSEMI